MQIDLSTHTIACFSTQFSPLDAPTIETVGNLKLLNLQLVLINDCLQFKTEFCHIRLDNRGNLSGDDKVDGLVRTELGIECQRSLG